MASVAEQPSQDQSKLDESRADPTAVPRAATLSARPRLLSQRPSWIGPLKPASKPTAPGQPSMSLPVTVEFSAPGLQPPVYICSNLTEPQWEPIEMERTRTTAGENRFQKSFMVDEGEYQYKIRLGPGDWWVIDDTVPTVDDGSGNRNNLIIIKPVTKAESDGPAANDSSPNTATQPSVSIHPVEAVLPSTIPKAQTPFSGIEKPTAELNKPLSKDDRMDSIMNAGNSMLAAEELEVKRDDDDDDEMDMPPLLHHETLTPTSDEHTLAPLLRHESISTMYTTSEDGSLILEDPPYEMFPSRKESAPPIPEEADPNDPTLHRFPTHTEGIYEQIHNAQQRLPEDLPAFLDTDPTPPIPAVVTVVADSAKLDDLAEESEESDFEPTSESTDPAVIIAEGQITPPITPAGVEEEEDELDSPDIEEQEAVQNEHSPLLKRKLSENISDTPTGALATGMGIVVAVVTIVVGVFFVSGNNNK